MCTSSVVSIVCETTLFYTGRNRSELQCVPFVELEQCNAFPAATKLVSSPGCIRLLVVKQKSKKYALAHHVKRTGKPYKTVPFAVDSSANRGLLVVASMRAFPYC
jgi:hypothetical protein